MLKETNRTSGDARNLTYQEFVDILSADNNSAADDDLGVDFACARNELYKARARAIQFPSMQQRRLAADPGIPKGLLYQEAISLGENVRQAEDYIAKLRHKTRLLRQSRHPFAS